MLHPLRVVLPLPVRLLRLDVRRHQDPLQRILRLVLHRERATIHIRGYVAHRLAQFATAARDRGLAGRGRDDLGESDERRHAEMVRWIVEFRDARKHVVKLLLHRRRVLVVHLRALWALLPVFILLLELPALLE